MQGVFKDLQALRIPSVLPRDDSKL